MNETIVHLPFDVPLLPVKELRAGKLQCFYERGHLRYICFAGEEVVRMIYPAVRDEQWGTVIPHIQDEVVHCNDESFLVNYTALYQQEEINFSAKIAITGSHDSLLFEFKGEAVSSFRKNRIGLCVLHPINTCMGKEVLVTRLDGTAYNASFPSFISPHQPFKDVRKMECVIDAKHCIRLQFEGDVFETEDQCNWTDYSYKTYSTPLEKPFPALIEKGTKIEQSVEVKIIEQKTNKNNAATILLSDACEACPFPSLGYGLSAQSLMLAKSKGDVLKQMPFGHCEQTLDLSLPSWKEELQQVGAVAQSSGIKLALTVLFSQAFEEECRGLLTALEELSVKPASLLPLHHGYRATPYFLLEYVYPKIKAAFPPVQVGFGTDKFFAELNRNRPLDAKHDFVAFGFYPQVHASDTRTVIENLQSLKQVMASIRRFTQKPIVVSPISFAEPTGKSDERLHTSFGAAWFLLCLKALRNARQLTFSGVELSTDTNERASPLLAMLHQLKRFQPVCIRYDEAADKISFENAAGERLTFVVSPEFNNAIALPQRKS